MLPEYEALDLGLTDEQQAAETAGLLFLQFPIGDRGTPDDLDAFNAFLSRLERWMRDGKRIGVHCHACIGRAPLVCATLLVRAGMPAANAWEHIAAVRGLDVPDTPDQRDWVDRYKVTT